MIIDDTAACVVYTNLTEGSFIRRINRFTAEVMVYGIRTTAHVKNTGRLGELLIPGAAIMLQHCTGENRKTAYDLISVYKNEIGWVNIDSLAPNMLMKQYLERGHYDLVKPEFNWGKSRFDFYMKRDGIEYLTEVKGCTLAYDLTNGVGRFPDAPTERGVKHLNELAAATDLGYRCSIVFVLQMNGFRHVEPNDEAQPEFRKALIRAAKSGVRVFCYSCYVGEDRIALVETADETGRYL